MAGWQDQCPLEGRCGECGLQFEWHELLSAAVKLPTWCIEFAVPARLGRATVATLLMMLRPWRFWASLRMTHPLRWRRLALFGTTLLILGVLAFALAQGMFVNRQWANAFGPASSQTTSTSRASAIARAVLLPFSNEPLATVTAPWGTYAWTSPRDYLRYYWSGAVQGAVGTLAFVAICPLVVVGLVASRRRAGVRWEHLVRISGYSSVAVLIAWALGLGFVISWQWLWWVADEAWAHGVEVGLMIAFPSMMFLWWWLAIRRYLRMEHAAAIATGVTAIGLLGALAVSSAMMYDLFEHVLDRVGLLF